MPIKLIPPRQGKTPYWYGRGSYLGIALDRSTKAVRKSVAKRVIRQWEDAIERGEYPEREPEDGAAEQPAGAPTFLSAAVAYGQAGYSRKYIKRLIGHFRETPLPQIDQAAIDAAAVALYPTRSPATRNRQVYTPVSAILQHAGHGFQLKRPKGAQGRTLLEWLWPEQAFALFAEAAKLDVEFGILLEQLTYTPVRLSEELSLRCDDLRIEESFAFLRDSKNGDPRPLFLPPYAIASLKRHPRGLDRRGERLFRFHKGGHLYSLLKTAAWRAGVELPERQAFHLLAHTHATWMRRFGGLDDKGLVATGRWRDIKSAARYSHVVVSEEAKQSLLLPTPPAWRKRGKSKRTSTSR
jgi:integrase